MIKSTDVPQSSLELLGLLDALFLFTYLGVPTFYGRAKSTYFEHLVDNVRKALECWKAKILSFGW